MRGSSSLRHAGRSRAVLIVPPAVLLLLTLALTGPARSEGVQWEPLTIDQALAKAEELGALVMVDVYASHCHQCKVMDEELWETPEGAAFADGLVAVRFPSDKPEGIELQRRYPVLGLPLVIFLNPDGTEIDRIVNFREQRSWLAEARMLKAGVDPLPQLEQQLQAKPDDDALLYVIFEKYLYRNRPDDAEALLERMIKLDPQRNGGTSTQALGMLARFYDYFRGDIGRAQFIWRTIVEEYPASGAVSSGIVETFEYHQHRGTLSEWVSWICPIALAHPTSRYLNRYAATMAMRAKLTDPCLAQAARNASKLETIPKQQAYMDSIAVILEGEDAGGGKR